MKDKLECLLYRKTDLNLNYILLSHYINCKFYDIEHVDVD